MYDNTLHQTDAAGLTPEQGSNADVQYPMTATHPQTDTAEEAPTVADTDGRKSPGAPLGNVNRLKHGRYSHRLPLARLPAGRGEFSKVNQYGDDLAKQLTEAVEDAHRATCAVCQASDGQSNADDTEAVDGDSEAVHVLVSIEQASLIAEACEAKRMRHLLIYKMRKFVAAGKDVSAVDVGVVASQIQRFGRERTARIQELGLDVKPSIWDTMGGQPQ